MIDAHTASGGGLFSALRSLFGEADRAAPETAVQDRKVDRQIQAGTNAANGDPVDEVMLSPDAQQRLARLQAGGNEEDPGWNAASRDAGSGVSAQDRRPDDPARDALSKPETAASPPPDTAASQRMAAPISAYQAAERLAPPARYGADTAVPDPDPAADGGTPDALDTAGQPAEDAA